MTVRSPALIIAPLSRVDRAAGRMLRDSERKERGLARRRGTRAEVTAHEALIERLTKIHQVEFARIDWADIEGQGPVVPTVARDAVSAEARRRLAAYRAFVPGRPAGPRTAASTRADRQGGRRRQGRRRALCQG